MEDSRSTVSLTDRVATLRAARDALTGMGDVLWQAPGAELASLLTLVDEVAGLAGAGRVAVTREAFTRGEITASQAGSMTGWVTEHAPGLAVSGGAGQVAVVVEAGVRAVTRPVTDAVCAARAPVPVGVAIIRETERLRPQLMPEAVPTVVEAMLTIGAGHGVRAVRELRARLIAEYGWPGQLQADQDAAAGFVALSAPVGDELGAFTYRLVVDAEGKAVVEAAIGPLSRPVPDADGAPDRRPARQRRGQALIEVCRRATAAGDRPPAGVKTTLVVTMGLAELTARLSAGVALGSTESGTVIAPETVRRLACDAQVIPAVLGGAGEVLDWGRSVRLFTPGQVKALWLRDQGCTFPGCGTPAHWCDAHHVTHWVDGGLTDLSNAVLLRGRHHTVVHRDRLTATITAAGVAWDTAHGSYDRALSARSQGSSPGVARGRAPDPGLARGPTEPAA
mgnify:FL=1